MELELIPDPDMYIFFEKGTRGGVSYICNRYSKASKRYLKSQDPKEESKHIIHLDANNLYGYAISKFLPTSGFKWIDPKEFELNKYTINSSKRCVLEVNLEYPKELRELHNDYPLSLDKIPIDNVINLVPNIFDKEKYVIHFENLQLKVRIEAKKYIVY